MRSPQILSAMLGLVCLASCETTTTAGKGNQESKRLAAKQQQLQQRAQTDESQANLWTAQENNLNRDGNPGRRY
jgi:hypothetical protein